MKRAYDSFHTVIEKARHRGAVSFDALWEAVARIVDHDPPLYIAAGYATADAFFREELGETRRNAFRFLRVARFASPAEEETYGTTKLDAALSYIEAKLGAPLEHPPLPIAFARLRIPVGRGKTAAHVSLDKARVEDIVAATRVLTKTDDAPTSSVERALKSAFAKHPKLGNVQIRVRNGFVHFSSVPVASLGVFATVVHGVQWAPAAEAREDGANHAKRATRSKKARKPATKTASSRDRAR